MQDNIFTIEQLEFAYGTNKVIDNLSLNIQRGQITTLIGANGCGKSTLFNLMTRNLKADSGQILMQGSDISRMKIREYAKKAAIVHQYNVAPGDLTVEKLVSYGRNPYRSFGRTANNSHDEEKINWAMKITDIERNKNALISDLSGGQKQRVWIAMALAQDTEVLFLDEPTTYLDIRYQLEILRMIKKLNKEYGMTIIMVLHDINQAMFYSDTIVAMKNGCVLQNGEPSQIVKSGILNRVYDIELQVADIEGKEFVLSV